MNEEMETRYLDSFTSNTVSAFERNTLICGNLKLYYAADGKATKTEMVKHVRE